MKNRTKRLLLLAALPAIAACASAPKKPTPEKSVAAAKKADEARETYLKSVIHVECSVYRVGTSFGNASACRTVDFSLEDEDQIEIARKNPNREGAIDFPVSDGKSFRLIPKVTSDWTIEQIPAGELKAGDSVRIILRK